jgi:hypothetical protein
VLRGSYTRKKLSLVNNLVYYIIFFYVLSYEFQRFNVSILQKSLIYKKYDIFEFFFFFVTNAVNYNRITLILTLASD